MKPSQSLLVIGAGIAGVTAALEAAEAGAEVVLVEREPSIGGRVLRSHNYFPKLCPPSCGMEINTRRLERNPRIRVLTSSQVTAAEQTDGGWAVTVTTRSGLRQRQLHRLRRLREGLHDRGGRSASTWA